MQRVPGFGYKELGAILQQSPQGIPDLYCSRCRAHLQRSSISMCSVSVICSSVVPCSCCALLPFISHAAPFDSCGYCPFGLVCPRCCLPCYHPPPPHTQASIARRILSKWGQGYADFSGKDDLALIADLSGLNGAKITLAGVTYDQLELALDGSEVYGFRQGVELFTAIADARVLKRVKKVPLLGVAHDVSGANGGVESGGPKMGEQGIPCLRRRGSGGKGGREKGSKGGREGSMRRGEGARDGAHQLGTEGEGGCKHGGCVKRGPL
jgi:hypothetical protein